MAMDVKSGGGGRGPGVFDNINVTPMVDVFLVLLIITMVSVTLDQFTAYKVKHSEASSGEPPPVDDQIAISINPDGGIFVGNEQVAGADRLQVKENLIGILTERVAQNPQIDTISVVPDKDAKAQFVIDVIEAGKKAKINKFSLVAKVKRQ